MQVTSELKIGQWVYSVLGTPYEPELSIEACIEKHVRAYEVCTIVSAKAFVVRRPPVDVDFRPWVYDIVQEGLEDAEVCWILGRYHKMYVTQNEAVRYLLKRQRELNERQLVLCLEQRKATGESCDTYRRQARCAQNLLEVLHTWKEPK